MTIREVSEKYKIPLKILQEYEAWRSCEEDKKAADSRQYDESDLERLSMIMTLHDIGFDTAEIKRYMQLLMKGKSSVKEREQMLNEKRNERLDEIHRKQKQLDRIDYLRFELHRNE